MMLKKQVEKHMLWQSPQIMSKEKLRILINAFFTSQFGYCPLGLVFVVED